MTKVATIVMACDKSEHVWNSWHQYWTENWDHETGWDTYFVTETIDATPRGTIPIKVGKVPWETWTNAVLSAVEKVEEKGDYDYIFLTMEDVFIQKKFDKDFMHRIIQIMDEQKLDRFDIQRISDNHGWVLDEIGQVGEFPVYMRNNDGQYILNLGTCIWRKDFLKKYLFPNMSPRGAEIDGSKILSTLLEQNKEGRIACIIRTWWWTEVLGGGGNMRPEWDSLRR